MITTEKPEIPHILESYEIFAKALTVLGFPKPSQQDYEKALAQWKNAEESRDE